MINTVAADHEFDFKDNLLRLPQRRVEVCRKQGLPESSPHIAEGGDSRPPESGTRDFGGVRRPQRRGSGSAEDEPDLK